MDYTYLFKDSNKKPIVGIVGASKGFGYTVLAQMALIDQISLRIVSSRNTEECLEVLKRAGYDKKQINVCNTIEELNAVNDKCIIVTTNNELFIHAGITALVECTGNIELSASIAERALKNGINVYMVSKETDSVCGAYLNHLAHQNGMVYALVNGDQPRNLIDLYSWSKLLGLDIVAIGKASEYDFVWDIHSEQMTYTDGNQKFWSLREMKDYWSFQSRDTLEKRRELLKEHLHVISADLCEMSLVSNVTGFKPASRFLNYPVAKINELANIFIPREDGGILDHSGVIDVFYQLREKEEASFAGGEFIIIRCDARQDWKTLAGKGHVVSKNNKYACIYWPYHFMGLETPLSILEGDLLGVGVHPETRQVSIMGAVAETDLKAGTSFKVTGHHHQIEGLVPQLVESAKAERLVPFYLLNSAVLKKHIRRGEEITMDDVIISQSQAYKMYTKGLELC